MVTTPLMESGATLRALNAGADAKGIALAARKHRQIYDRVLALEANAEELLGYRLGALPFWCLVRLAVLLRMEDRVRGDNNSGDIYLKPRRVGIARSVSYLANSLFRTPFWHADRELLFVCSGVNRVREPGGTYTNSRVDYFADALQDRRLLLIEGADNHLQYAWPRAIAPVSFRGGLTLPAAMWSRLSRPTPAERVAMDAFVALLRSSLGDALAPADYEQLGQHLCQSIARSKMYSVVCRRLVRRLKPRLIFIESAHFGVDIELLMAAHEAGVTTAEYQHGAVNPECPYHNFHPRLLRAGYDRCLPQFFLSYGEFWHKFLTTSAEVVAIGNPYIEQMRAAQKELEVRAGSVYFLSSAYSPHLYMDKMREMLAQGCSVVFRPHPVERPLLAERYGKFFRDTGIELDLSDDFCARLQAYESIVGDGQSTSIFEAFALAPGRVFVMEMNERITEEFPNHDFLPTIRSAQELRSGPTAAERRPGVAATDLFAGNWREQFARFIARVVGP